MGSIIIGALTLLNVVSKFNTDRIKPLMDTITADGVQPVVALKDMSDLFVIAGVLITILSLAVVILYIRGGTQTRTFAIFLVSIYQ